MAGFDPSLDKELFAESVTLGTFKLSVKVMSYNDGMQKMQLVRERINQEGETTFAKLGRLTLDEVDAVTPLMQKAKEFMESNKESSE